MSFADDYLKIREEEKKRKKSTSNTSYGNQYVNLVNTYGLPTSRLDEVSVPKYTGLGGEKEYVSALEMRNRNLNTEEKKATWFQKGAFEDGYQFGDVSKTLIGTLSDVNENITEAVFDATENLIDTTAYGIGAIGGIFDKDFKKDTKEFIAKEILKPKESGEAVATYANPVGWVNLLVNGGKTEENSVLGDKSDGLVQSASHLVGSAALQYVGVPAWLTMGVNAFGSEIESASQQGATYLEAGISGGISAAAEIIFEKISGGIKFGGNTLDDLAEPLFRGIKNKLTRTIAKYGADMVGEGTEEVLTETVSALGRKFTYLDDKEWNEILSKEELFDAFVGGAVMSGVAGGGKMVKSAQTGRDYVTGLNDTETKVVDKLYQDAIAEKEKGGTKLKQSEKNEIYNNIVERMDKGDIGINDIENVLGGKTLEEYNSTVEREKLLTDEISQLENLPKEQITVKQSERLAEAREELKNLANKDELKSKLSDEVYRIAKNSRLVESYNEKARKGQAFEDDLTQYKDEKEKAAVERAIKSGVLNNTRRSHELVKVLSKIEADKGIVFDYTDNAKLKESGFAIEGKTVNGFEKNGTVTLNVQSAKSWQSVVGHEITHVLEGTESYTHLREALFKYAESKGELATRKANLTELYKNVDADIDAELTADLVGDYLFSDSGFVKNLTSNRNLFQKIYAEIKYLWNTATGKEKAEIEKVKREFDNAWKEMSVNTNAESDGKTKLSVSQVDGIDYVRAEKNIFTKEDGTLATEKEVFDSLVGKKIALSDGEVEVVKYLPEKNMYNELYRRYPNKLGGITDVKQLNTDVNYNMEELLSASQMKTANEPDKDNRHAKQGVVDFDTRTVKFYDGENAYTIDLSIANLQNGKKVAYAKRFYGYDAELTKKIQTAESRVQEKYSFNQQSVSDDIVTENGNGVKTQFSLSEDSNGNELSLAVQKRFANSKAVDENGKLKVLYHGTASGEFYTFDKSKGSVEGDFGSGFYFTDNESDVESNYEGGGPDFENKVVRLAEQIESEEEIDYSEAKARAREELYKGSNKFEVYLNIENPAIVGETTLLDYESFAEEYDRDDYDSDEDYESDVEYLIQDKIDEILWEVERNIDFYGFDDNRSGRMSDKDKLSAVLWETINEGGIGVEQLKAKINDLYLEDNNGNMVGNEVTRQIIESLGYDGIIDNTVSSKFNMNLEEGTTHYIVFKPNQIKSIDNQNPTDNPDIRKSLSNEGEDIAPVGTPLKDLYLAPTQEDIAKMENTPKVATENTAFDAPMPTDFVDEAPMQEQKTVGEHARNERTVNNVPQNTKKGNNKNLVKSVAEYIDRLFIAYDSANLNGDSFYSNRYDAEIKEFYAEIDKYQKEKKLTKSIKGDLGYGAESVKDFATYIVEDWQTNYDSNKFIHRKIDELTNTATDNSMYDAPLPDESNIPPEVEYDYAPDTTALDEKALKNISKTLRETLSLTAEEAKAIQDVVQKYSTSEMPSREELFAEIKEKFGVKAWAEKNEDIAAVKQRLRSSNLKVSDNLKGEVAYKYDKWSNFRKKYSSKIKFSQEGVPVDVAYMELSSEYPAFFPEDITNEADQLFKIAEVADMNIREYYSQSLDNDTIQEAVNIVTDEVRKYKENLARISAEENAREALDSVAPPKAVQLTDGSRGDALLLESLDNYPIKTVEDRIAEQIRAVEGELADNKQLRREAAKQYEDNIAKLANEYMSKKRFDTKVANNILQRISRLEDLKASVDAKYAKRISDLETRLEKMNDEKFSRAMHKQEKMTGYAEFAENLLGDTSAWVDKKTGIQYATNTEHRNLRDIVRDVNGNKDTAKADAIYNALSGEYNRNQAERNREDNEISKKYRELKVNHVESVYANMLGELRHNPETTLTEKVVNEYYEKHKNKIDTKKVDKFIEYVRTDLDNFYERLNAKLREQGMKEIPYRKGYFPHRTEPKQNFIQKLLNWKAQDNDIPTSIAGLTEDFKPVKSWQSFDKQRHTDETDYDLMRMFQNYKNGALDWIYHIEDIQKRRAVENHIRYTHSDEGIQARIKEVYANEELDADEAQAQIEHILAEAKNPLNNFVQDFMTKTNILAGKKNSLDRTVEQATNRHIYSIMSNVQNRMSANMVLANFRSALTNFIPITQSWAQVSPLRSLQATKDTIKNAIKDDGLINKSTFLTNRLREADSLYKTNWDKVLDKAGIMFEVVDNFSSQVIWRSKYSQNLAKGMSESDAIANADQFAENVMAGRSKGNEPTLFNAKNPFVKAFTMFQLEVNNQYGYLFKDVPTDLKAETEHWKFNLTKGYATAFIGAHIYNALMEQISGSGAALDPIGIIRDLLRDLGLGDEEEKKEGSEVLTNFADNVIEELPFVGGFFGGGRVPISSALPYEDDGFKGFAEDLGNLGDGGGKNIGKELMNPLLNVGLPVGGGQLKKSIQGLNMFKDTNIKRPVKGSYTDSGDLRFPVEDTFGNKVQAALFGQWANENARNYIENGRKPLSLEQAREYRDVELPIADYWKYRDGLKGLKTNAEKADYIDSLDMTSKQKNLLMNNILDRKENIDMSNYSDYGGWEEFDYAQKNPEKYEFFKANGISYSDYKNADEDGKNAYTWAYENPEKFTFSKVVSDDVVKYRSYISDLYDIRADKDRNGKSISGTAKRKKLDYINNLDIDYESKIILFKSLYPSDDTYNNQIIEYVNNRDDLTYEERITIYTELGFRVKDGYVYW